MQNLTATNAMESIVTQISRAIHPYGTFAEAPHPAASLPGRSAHYSFLEALFPDLYPWPSKGLWAHTSDIPVAPGTFLLIMTVTTIVQKELPARDDDQGLAAGESADSTEIEYTSPPLINNQSKHWLLMTHLIFGPFLLVWLTWAGRRSPLPSKVSSSFQQFQSAPRLS
jgi:hypothetical protein